MGSQSDPKRIAFLGSYMPRMCGIATFTHDLHQAITEAAPGADCYVAAVTDIPTGYDYPEEVRLQIEEKDLRAYRRVSDVLYFKNANTPTFKMDSASMESRCSTMLHGDTLILPYAISDRATVIATIPLAPLLQALQSKQ